MRFASLSGEDRSSPVARDGGGGPCAAWWRGRSQAPRLVFAPSTAFGGPPPPRGRGRNGVARVRARALCSLATALILGACSSFGLGGFGAGGEQQTTAISLDVSRAAGAVSAYRAQHGLGPVRVESRLMQAAATHARTMGGRDRISHSLGGALPRRIGKVGYNWSAAAENLGAGYANLDAAMAGWKASSGHRKNLLNRNVTEIGIAAVATPPGSRYRTYWALILAAPRAAPQAPGPFAMGPVR